MGERISRRVTERMISHAEANSGEANAGEK
jgi:hypothetical protein